MPAPYPSGPPVDFTWAKQMMVKAGYLRGAAAAAVQIAGTPPMFTGIQQSAQAIANNTDTSVSLDTELYDNLNMHNTVTSSAWLVWGMFAGWYLAQGVAVIDYTGGAGAIDAGIGFSSHGGALTIYHGARAPASGTAGQRTAPAVAKLLQMINVGTVGGATNDYMLLSVKQTSGASQNTFVSTNLYCQFQAKMVAVGSGVTTTVPSLPLGYAPQWPVPQVTLTAQANSGTASLTVSSATGLIAGGTLGIDQGTAIAETVTIAGSYAPGSLTVPLVLNLVNTHASGALVAVPVSAAFLNTAVRDVIRRILYPPICEAFYNAGTQTVAQQNALPAVGTTVQVDTTRVDNYSAFNTTTHTWTAPFAGTYWCYFQAQAVTSATCLALAAGLTVTSANYNAGTQVTLWGGAILPFASGDFNCCAIVRRRLRLNAGDTVLPAVFQHDSGTATITMNNITGAVVSESRLIIVWEGA